MKICKRILSFLLALTFCLNFFIPSVTSKEAEISQFKAFDLIIERQGAASNNFRFVSFVSNIPFDVTEDNVIGLLVSGTANNGTEKVPFVSKIVKSEFKDNTVIFSVAQTDDLKAVNQASYSFELKVYPELYTGNEKAPEISKEAMEGSKSDFEPFNLKIDRQGRNGEFFRFVVKASDIPFEVTSDNVKGLKVSGTVEGTLPFESEIGKVEIKDNGKTIIFSVKQTKDITSLEFEKSTFDLKVSPACYESEKPEEAESEIIVPAENRPDTDIAVNLDGNWLEFDVEPLIINGRTMVPMRAIFEALGCSVSWDQVSQTAIGVRNGKVVYCTINSNDASVDGKATTIDQPPALINGRTLVPLRFVSEAYGCTVQWDSDTRSIYIKSDDTPIIYYLSYSEFSTLGTWSVNSTEKFLQGISDSANENSSNIKYEPAKAVIRVQKSGKYRLWVKARDYSSNKPGSRYFNVAIDNNESATTFGKHGKEGFYWEDGGEFELTEGVHTISLLHAVYVPECKIDFAAEGERLRKIMDKWDSVNIFVSEGAGVKDIIKEMTKRGEEVPVDAFGHPRLDKVNVGQYIGKRFGQLLGAEKVQVFKSGYFARAAAPCKKDLKLIEKCARKAGECALSGERRRRSRREEGRKDLRLRVSEHQGRQAFQRAQGLVPQDAVRDRAAQAAQEAYR